MLHTAPRSNTQQLALQSIRTCLRLVTPICCFTHLHDERSLLASTGLSPSSLPVTQHPTASHSLLLHHDGYSAAAGPPNFEGIAVAH